MITGFFEKGNVKFGEKNFIEKYTIYFRSEIILSILMILYYL
jgi:hypothetical protein